jgi:cytochrome c oxidase subunit II
MFKRKVATALAGLGAGARAFAYESSYNLPVGATDISARVHFLHMMMFWVCVVIAALVFAVMIYSIWKFRRSKGAIADKTLTHSTNVEVVWTMIPVIILVATAIPAARTLIAMEDTRNSELTVKVVGYQWKWQYEYLGKGVSFYSTLASESNFARQRGSGIDPNTVPNYLLDVDHPLVVPVDTKVRLLLTGNDVIHSWWVPDFAVKKDTIPGFINEAWFKANRLGRFTGQCAELCGRDHGYMPIVVNVVSKADFATWLAAQQAAAQPGAPAAEAPAAAPPAPGPATPSAT